MDGWLKGGTVGLREKTRNPGRALPFDVEWGSPAGGPALAIHLGESPGHHPGHPTASGGLPPSKPALVAGTHDLATSVAARLLMHLPNEGSDAGHPPKDPTPGIRGPAAPIDSRALRRAEQTFSILTMRSTPSGNLLRADEDLTTSARIRDAAIVMIGRTGFTAATVRAIATEVGVSPGLLLHHFGSKDGLRRACDEYVLGWYAAKVRQLTADDSPANVIGMSDSAPEMLPLAAYIRRSMTDGGPFARRVFDALVADTETYLRRSVGSGRVRATGDEHGRAVLMVVISLGAQLLAEYLAPPGTPADDLVPAASAQLMLPGLELYTYGLFTDAQYLDAYRQHLTAQPLGSRKETRTP